jgi:hypothetical protein
VIPSIAKKPASLSSGCGALHAMGSTLTSLDLSFNGRITRGDFLTTLPHLTELDLSLNAWVDDDVVGNRHSN